MLPELAFVFLRLGATSFGGPLAHIALMRAEFVERRAWLSEREFVDSNGAVALVPGPSSTQLAMYIGFRRAGFVGLIVAGVCFILPAMALVLMLAALYARYGTLPAARAILWGVQPVVVALVAQALWKFAPIALPHKMSYAVALACGAGLFCGARAEVVLLGAGALGLFAAMRVQVPNVEKPKPHLLLPPLLIGAGGALKAATVGGVFAVFLRIGCLVYGSGYVLLAYLRAELVEKLGWVSDKQLLDAVAVGQMTPGPVFTTATFLGFQIAGYPGALAATLGIFGPSFVFVALLSTVFERLQNSPRARAFLGFVNAASFALMAWVTLELARHTAFPSSHLDGKALCLGAVCAVVLWKSRLNSAWLLGAGALVGWVLGGR